MFTMLSHGLLTLYALLHLSCNDHLARSQASPYAGDKRNLSAPSAHQIQNPPYNPIPPARKTPQSTIIERIPTQRTRTGVAALEPLEQTARVEQVLARAAALAGQLLVRADDAVADGALGLALDGAVDVFAPGGQAVG